MQSGLYIDGRWVSPVLGGTLDVVNPATEEIVHRIAAGTSQDIDLAVAAARGAFDAGPWPRLSGTERAAFLRAIATEIRERRNDLARLEVIDNGKPMPEALWDIDDAAGCFEYYAGLAEDMDASPPETIDLADERFVSKVVREPIGVCGAIIPWNFPLLMAAWKVAPALAAGCTMILKPSELTALTALELGKIADAVGLPAGVLNIVTGDGPAAGQPLIDHRDVDKLAFTGSGAIGSKVMAAAARNIKCVSLELGGKSPLLVFEDTDVDQAVEWIMFGIFWNQGQVCSATSRVLVHTSIRDRLLTRLTEETRKIRLGNGLSENVLLGPLVSRKQLERVSAFVERAKSEGFAILAGGNRRTIDGKGFFFEPTIILDPATDSEIWREEVFGPVVCIRSFSKEGEAIELANDTRFGLAAAVLSQDLARANRIAAALRAGIVWINCSQPTFTEAPWGGYKESGIGRELGRWGLENYLETKQITRFQGEAPWGWYIK